LGREDSAADRGCTREAFPLIYRMESRTVKTDSLTGGYFWNFGATALPLVSAFITSLIIARWMGPRAIGLINWTMALATVFLIIGKFGVDGASSRLISEYKVAAEYNIPPLLRRSVLMRLIFTVPASVAATLLAPRLAAFFGEEALLPLFRISGLLIFAVSINELAALLVLGIRRFSILFSMRLAMMVLKVGLVLASALLYLGEEGIIQAYIIGALLPGLAVLVYLFRTGRHGIRRAGSGDIWRRLFRLSATLAASSASVTIYSMLDKLMLGYFSSATQVGLYSMARNLVETSLFPTFALIMTLRPALAGAFVSGDIKRCSYLVNRSMKSSMIYALAIIVVFACLARPLVVGLFKEEFSDSAELLLLFLPLMAMRSVGSIILPGLIAADRAGTYARLTFIGAALNFSLNIVLIPTFGAKGAVVSTILSYLPIEAIGLKKVAEVIPGLWRRGDLFGLVGSSAAAAAIILVYTRFVPAPSSLVVTLVEAVALTAVFAGLLLALKVVTTAELRDLMGPFLRLVQKR